MKLPKLFFKILLQCFFATGIFSQGLYSHESLTIEDGLSHNRVSSIEKDQDGFMWFGTENGINRYDGYAFKQFYPDKELDLKVNCPSIEKIFIDSRNNMWIGTKSGGVNRFSLVDNEFENFSYCSEGKQCLSDQRVVAFCEDNQGSIWMGTWGGGINRFDYNTGEIKHYLVNTDNPIEGNIGDVICSQNGDVWAAGYYGLWKYNRNKDSFEIIDSDNEPFSENGYVSLVNILEDTLRNKLWIGTWSRGLIEYDLKTGKFQQYLLEENSIISNKASSNVYSMLFDQKQDLWIGTWGAGLWKFNVSEKSFRKIDLKTPDFHAKDVILDIFNDGNGNVWVGTNSAGVIRLNHKLAFKNYLFDKNLNPPIVLSVLEDEDENVFLGTLQQGVFWKTANSKFEPVPTVDGTNVFEVNKVYKTQNGKIWVSGDRELFEIVWKRNSPRLSPCRNLYKNDDLQIGKVTAIVESGNLMFIGTKQNALFLFKKTNTGYLLVKNFEVNSEQKGMLQNTRISSLHLDEEEQVWVGTYGGLQLIDSGLNVKSSIDFIEPGQSLTCDIITDIKKDSKGRVLVGTPCGLNILNQNGSGKYTIKNITTEEGLPEDFVFSILEDNGGGLWLNTNNSIVNIDLDSTLFNSYFSHDGIGIRNFERGGYRNKKGELLFCGSGGFIRFNPEKIKKVQFSNRLVISSFKVLNKEIHPQIKYDKRVLLKQNINEAKSIDLYQNENEFSFGVSYLNFNNPEKHHYAYKLKGYNEDWVNTGTRRHISFSNLDPGKYFFKARASSNDGLWQELENPLMIVVHPPWYRTFLAYGAYVLFIVLVVLFIRNNAIKQMRLQRNIEMLRLRGEQSQKMNDLKFRFFTNISHEFVTPLTLILGPIKELYDHSDQYGFNEQIKLKLKIVGKNANNLLRLINQLLDFRKSETSKMELKAQKTNILEFLSEICYSFTELAKQNQIYFYQEYNIEETEIWCDRNKLEIIINNLLSNSVKYIKEKGVIRLVVDENDNEVVLKVVDNGLGIPKSEQDKVFDRFYQIERSQNYGSAGIGLALVKRFVELHKGSINVNSAPNEHTEFIIKLPKGDGHLKPQEKSTEGQYLRKKNEQFDFPQMMQKIQSTYERPAKNNVKVLVVEDNADVRTYLTSLLVPHYAVFTANNGKEGYEKAMKQSPHVIVSDIMMPEMDGFEMCQKLKKDKSTQLIPIILLTAKAAEDYSIFGLKAGADDYISKPFDPAFLLEKIANLLNSRELLKENFSKQIKISGSEIEITPFDERFINGLIKFIENNFLNPELDADLLASEFNMSRSSLYRKLKSITGYSINHFIRKIRLDRAVQLLDDSEKTITEIAYQVGFNDLKYFRESFAKQFGSTPGKYRKGLK